MGRPERIHSIEALRGLAALAVTWFHLTNTYQAGAVRASGYYGWLGVDCFFVISGFVIPYSLYTAGYRINDFGRFLARRLIRLEPPYIASIALVIVLQIASIFAPGFHGTNELYSLPQILFHLLYLIPLTPYSWISVVYWSLAYEFTFYLAAGLLFPLLWTRHLIFTAALSLAAFISAYLLTHVWDANLLLFLFGIAGVRYYVGRDRIWEFVVCIVATAGLLSLIGSILPAFVALATTLAIVFIKIPARRPLMALGAISYSLYLIHVPIGGRVINLGMRFIDGQVQELALSLFALAVTLFAAWAFYYLIERASTRASKRIILRPAGNAVMMPSAS